MISHDNQPCARGSAAEPREVQRGSRSNIPSRVLVVALAAAATTAAAIDDRFRMNCAKVAPSIQFLQTDTSIFGTNDGVISSASRLAPQRGQSPVASALAPRRGPGRLGALSAELFYSFVFFNVFFIYQRTQPNYLGVCYLRQGINYPLVEGFAGAHRRWRCRENRGGRRITTASFELSRWSAPTPSR